MTEDDGSFSVASGLPDESFSFNDSFSGADSAGKQLGIEDKQQDEIAGNDSVGVSRLRGMVVAMLLLTAALVITSTYIFLSREETDEFEKSFTQSARTIKDAARIYARNGVNALQSLADTIASEAQFRGEEMALNETWPFVTTHDFEIKGAHTRLDSTTELVMFAPIVAAGNRERWEEYSVDHQDWLVKSRQQRLQTSTWFENEFYSELGGQGMDDGAMDHGSVDHANMDHSMSSGGVRRFLQGMESMGGMDGMNLSSMVASNPPMDMTEATDTDDATGGADMPGTNSSGMAVSSPTMEMNTTEMESSMNETMDHSMDSSMGETMDHSMDSSMGETMDHSTDSSTGHHMDHSTTGIPSKIYQSRHSTSQESRPFYAPLWQMSPPPKDPSIVNFDLVSDPVFEGMIRYIMASGGQTGLSQFVDVSNFYMGTFSKIEHEHMHDQFNDQRESSNADQLHPHTVIAAPVRSSVDADAAIVGILASVLPWDLYLSRLLPQGINGVYVVLENSCGQVVSYVINGPNAMYLGGGDLHQTRYDYLKETYSISNVLGAPSTNLTADHCEYTMHMYPSTQFRANYSSSRPEVFTAILAAVFIATGIVFLVYVKFVQRRQNKVMATALRTNAIVSSLFPTAVRDRMMKEAEEQAERDARNKTSSVVAAKHRLKNFLEDEPEEFGKEADPFSTKPIADLFPETTIMMADMVGFTAWSSVREPCQVFTLLETVYHAFDQIAKRRRVFKVETIGDCYVAVAGLPEPRKNHAVVMAQFANDCNTKLIRLVKQLEVTLGPDTADLTMRFGLHSGPVTAGVLRGERARFQLFGDTINTAARIETTGAKGRIHVSQETADLLIAAGKSRWLEKREEKVVAKGKGELQTYWVNTRGATVATESSHSSSSGSDSEPQQGQGQELTGARSGAGEVENTDCSQQGLLDDKTSRLIDWNTELLIRSLKQVVARRQALGETSETTRHSLSVTPGATVLDEVQETIELPRFDAEAARQETRPKDILLGPEVEKELHDYVTTIANMYRQNPFHNFEHASHVSMSVTKLLSRIVAPSDVNVMVKKDKRKRASTFASTLHDHTYGITSDPLTQFACVFSALIHDVDHGGVPNTQLIKESATIAAVYKGKSVAEQNSVDLAWDLLMDDRYENLRRTIYNSDAEFKRFRMLVVNAVMATDIMDKDLKSLRNGRWEKAFNGDQNENLHEAANRKATIVIEHLIQASDVAHTMQHWHIYRKWNARLFSEMYKAYLEGRAEKDPSEFWYKGEIGFFDFYIIPLAKKLQDCGVFGVSSYEYLNYAERNRAEWEAKGQELVAEMKAQIQMESPP